MPDVKIRAIEVADIEAIQELASDAYGAPASIVLLNEAAHAGGLAFGKVAVDAAGAVCGVVLCEALSRHNCYIDMLAVAASRRRRGIGRLLMKTAFEEIRHSGAQSASLVVSNSNHAAIALYSSLGFQRRADRSCMICPLN